MKKITYVLILLLIIVFALPGAMGKSIAQEKAADKKPAKIDPALYDVYTGHYRNEAGLVFTVTKAGNNLIIEVPAQPKMEFAPESAGRFINKNFHVRAAFDEIAPGGGKAARLVLRSGETEAVARRMQPKVAVHSGIRMDFRLSAAAAGPFEAKEEALQKYGGSLPAGLEILSSSPLGMTQGWFVVKAEPVISIKDLKAVNKARGHGGNFVIAFTLKPEAAEKMKAYTTANMGKRIATMLDGRVLFAPTINGVISKNGHIVGRFSEKEVNRIITLLTASINDSEN